MQAASPADGLCGAGALWQTRQPLWGPGEPCRVAGVQPLTASGTSALCPPPAPPPAGEHRWDLAPRAAGAGGGGRSRVPKPREPRRPCRGRLLQVPLLRKFAPVRSAASGQRAGPHAAPCSHSGMEKGALSWAPKARWNGAPGAGGPGAGGSCLVTGSPGVGGSRMVAGPGLGFLTFPMRQSEAFVRRPQPGLGLGFGEKPGLD